MLLQLVRAIRQSHADVPIFALSQKTDNTHGVIKGDLYGGALQDWLKLPVDDTEVIARVEGALRHQVCFCYLQVVLRVSWLVQLTSHMLSWYYSNDDAAFLTYMVWLAVSGCQKIAQ